MNELPDFPSDRDLDRLLAQLPLVALPAGFQARTLERLTPVQRPARLRFHDLGLPVGAGLTAVLGWMLFLWTSGRLGVAPLVAANQPWHSALPNSGAVWLLLAGIAGTLLVIIALTLTFDEQNYLLAPPSS